MEKSIYSREYSLFLEQLRKAREEKGLTQTELAEKLGQTQSFVSKVERGERRIDLIEVRAICSALSIPMMEFVLQIENAIALLDPNGLLTEERSK